MIILSAETEENNHWILIMAYCKKFLAGIHSINFSDEDAKFLKHALLSFAHDELEQELQHLKDKMASVSEQMPENELVAKQLQLYKEKLADNAAQLSLRLEELKELMDEKLELETSTPVIEKFTQKFASYFINIKHLSETLSDAPLFIKKQQTRFYTEILSRLGQKEQEKQLQTLLLEDLKDMVEHAIIIYEKEKDVHLRNQAKRLVQMGIYEIVRHETKKVNVSGWSSPYGQYQDFLLLLSSKIPSVGSSDVIDSLSQYKALDGKSIGDLLVEIEDKAKISEDEAWGDETKASAFIARKALFHKLRFGQEDRREYVQIMQSNLKRDLFWARDIRDIELFTVKGVSDEVFSRLRQQDFLTTEWCDLHLMSKLPDSLAEYKDSYIFIKKDRVRELYYIKPDGKSELIGIRDFKLFEAKIGSHIESKGKTTLLHLSAKQFQEATLLTKGHISAKKTFTQPVLEGTYKSKTTAAERRLCEVIEAIKALPEKEGAKRGNASIVKGQDLLKMQNLVKEKLKGLFSTPTVSVENNLIKVDFYQYQIDEKALTEVILKAGGLGSDTERLLSEIRKKATEFEKNIAAINLQGRNFSEIRTEIEQEKMSKELRIACYQQVDLLEKAFDNADKKEIKKLKLGNNKEILLRKLLELLFIAPIPTVTDDPKISKALEKIKANEFEEALKDGELEAAVTKAYENLAIVPISSVPAHVEPIIKKSQILVSKERENRLLALNIAFNSNKSAPEKAEEIAQVFLDEYRDMVSTLGLTKEDDIRLQQDIRSMATEMVLLVERTQKGKPALKKAEEAAYFSVIQQIAKHIKPPHKMSEMQFKIPHSSQPRQKITIVGKDGYQEEVFIELGGTKLPYSLIKPADGEFIFSYGGTRGMIAPFAGLDAAYVGEGKKKGRLFTHSRLLGVGQYGAVKEVESLLSGLNQITKKGYVREEEPTFSKTSRQNLKTRPITARPDPYYHVESDILQNLSKAVKASKRTFTGGTQYWLESDKPRPKGMLYAKDTTPQQYIILTERAQGETFAGTANEILNSYQKIKIEYHDPSKRGGDEITALTKMLSLSQALVDEAENLEELGFSHNDIKPENFLYKQNVDNSYRVRFIDWATGGFEKTYTGNKKELAEVFVEVFGEKHQIEQKEGVYFDKNGRFVKEKKGLIVYGINPTLEILHGARNGTLPYISPTVLGPDRKKQCVAADVTENSLNTTFDTNDPTMDNWALTTMLFGICNRQAYFALVKGRAVVDYIVPGILEEDGKIPVSGLAIVNAKRFDEFFACGSEIGDKSLETSEVYDDPNAVMFIPSNRREGEPLHLYRHLQKLKLNLEEAAKLNGATSPEQQLLSNIELILTTVHKAVATGQGLTKKELKAQLLAAQECLKDYEKLKDKSHQEDFIKKGTLQTILNDYALGKISQFDHLLEKVPGGLRRLEVLCTYPATKEQEEKVKKIFEENFFTDQLNDKFIGSSSPGKYLFKECIAHGKTAILASLLEKIKKEKNTDFVELVRQQGLLHYAAELGMTEAFNSLVSALRKAEASDVEIFKLTLAEYGPGKEQLQSAPYIKWASNCFHIAIRNNNEKQLKTILGVLPTIEEYQHLTGIDYEPIISKALHLCAVLGNKKLFNEIEQKYNESNPKNKLTATKILAMTFPPDRLSPYHLFLEDEATWGVREWLDLIRDAGLAKQFLAIPPKVTDAKPALIAVEKGNFVALSELILLGKEISLSESEWQQFLTQTDEQGKNVLNHILERGQLTYLTQFIKSIKDNAGKKSTEILIQLLGNPHPVNPLKNFLSEEANVTQQLTTVSELLDAICAHFSTATPEQQNARIVALLVNKDWLIEQAQDANNFKHLRGLLLNDALSIPYKQLLLKKLIESTKPATESNKFYEGLLADISPLEKSELDKQTQLEIFEVVARQTTDINDLLQTFSSGQEAVKELEETVNTLKEKVDELITSLEEEKKLTKELGDQLSETKVQLEESQLKSKQLEQEIDETKKRHEEELSDLRSEVESAKEGKSEAEAKLRLAQERHAKELEDITSQLEASQQEAEELLVKLQNQGEQLKEKLQTIERLRVSLQQLEQEKATLTEKLSEEKNLRESERKHLESLLDTETQAKLKAESDLKELKTTVDELTQTNEELLSKAQQLEEANSELLVKVSSLEKQVETYKEKVDELITSLEEEKKLTKELGDQLSETKVQLEESQLKSKQLEQEIDETKKRHEEELSDLRSEVESAKEGKSEAEAKLRLAQERHAKELEDITSQLEASQQEAEELLVKLQNQGEQLKEKLQTIERLRVSLQQLEQEKATLTEKLSEEKNLRESERKHLESLLDTETQAKLKAESDLKELKTTVDELTQTNEELLSKAQQLEEANSELLVKVSSLEKQVETYKEKVDELITSLEEEKKLTKELGDQLSETKVQLEESQLKSKQLEQEIDETKKRHEEELSDLRSEVESAKEGKSEAEAKLRLAQERHAKELEDITSQLEASQQEAEELLVKLQNQGEQLKEKLQTIERLRVSLQQLEQEKATLTEKLSEEKNLRESERKHLESLLDTETQAKLKAESDLKELKTTVDELTQTNEELLSKAQQLEEANSELLVKVSSLEKQVETYKEKVDELITSLEEEKKLTKELGDQLSETKVQLEESQLKSKQLEQEIDETKKRHEEELSDLRSEVESAKEGKSEAEAKLRLAQERHAKELEDITSQLEASQQEAEELLVKLQNQGEQLKEKLQTIERLRVSLQQLEQEKATLTEKLSEEKNLRESERKHLESLLDTETQAKLKAESDLKELKTTVDELTQTNEELLSKAQQLEEANSELLVKVSSLEKQVETYKEKVDELITSLEEEKKLTKELGDQLSETKVQLEESQLKSKQLEQEIDETKKRHEEELSDLRSEVESAKEGKSEAEAKLRLAQERHAKELEDITSQLEASQQEAEELLVKLQNQGEQLKEKLQTIERLRVSLQQLEQEKATLTEKLSEEKNLRESERKHLESLLDTETQAKLKAESDLKELKTTVDELTQTNEELLSKAQQLEEANSELLVKVSSLEKQVETYKEKVDELITSLEEEKKLTKELGDQLSETKVQLEESQLKSKQLEQEIDETKKRHEEELSDLRSEVESAKEGKSEAEAKLRLAQERHAKELEDITSQLEASQQEAEELLVKLQNQGEQLKEKLQTIERLRVSLQQLEQEKATLTEKLSEEKNLRESERKHLESLLDTETQAKLKAESDLKELKTTVDELTQTNEELLSKAQQLEEANSELLVKVSSLEKQVETYKEKVDELITSLEEEKKLTKELGDQLSETKVQLEESQLKSKQLEQEIDETKKRHEEELSDLRSEVESAKEGKSEAEAKLRLAQERHAKELEDITSQLEASQQEAEELLVKLQNQGEQLKEKLQTIERLRVSLQQLEQEKATLTEKLSEEKNLRESERKHLESLLDTETQAKLKAESDLKELKTTVDELTQTNEELLSKAQQLEEANSELLVKVSSLEKQVETYKEKVDELITSLEEEKKLTKELGDQLSETKVQLEESQLKSKQLEQEIDETKKRHEEELSDLRSEVESAKEGKSEAEAKLRLAQERHAKELEDITSQLEASQQEAEELLVKLQNQGEQLKEKLQTIERLRVSLQQLEQEKATLTEKLSEEKNLRESERKHLESLLDTETQAKLKAESDLKELKTTVDELTQTNEELLSKAQQLEEANSELLVKVSSLEKQVETYKEKVDELITSLEEEKKLTKELGDQLSETKVQLEESQLKSKQLEQEIDETKKRHEEELSDLRSEVESAKEGKSEAEAKLRLAQERHAKELEDITSQLEASQQEAEELLVKLQNQGEQLKEKLQTIERLRVSLQQLEQEKATLTEKLSEEKNLRESERKHLESLLDTETQAKLKAESDLKELKTTVDELTQTNEELLSKAQQLEEANELLKEVVADLRSEIKGYKEDIEQGKKELAEERRKTEKANEALEKEREVTQRLKEEIESMRLEMDRLREEMERREKKVDEREKAVESREQQVKRRENEVGQRESNVGVRETKLASKKDALREAKRAHKERIRQHSEERQRHEEDFRRREAAILRRRDPEDPQLVAQRKAIAKLKARIGVSKDDVLLINVRRAENNNDLIEAGLNRRLVSLLGTNDYLTIADAADERLTALRQARLQKKTNLLGANYQRILNHDKDELRDIYNHLKNITTLDKGIQSELKYLAKTSPIHWFNPGFQAAAKKHAEEMAPHYAKLADGCSVIVDYLKPLSHELNDQLKSLPAPGEMRGLNDAQKKAIEEHRAVLTRYLHQVNEELALYEPLYKQLYGDPHASHPLVKQGILKTIQQAKEDKHALKFLSFASSYSDHPQEERSAHFQEGYESDRDGNVTTVSGTVGGGVYYRPVQWAKAGYFRQYEINGDSDFHGYFIEEHYSSNYNPAEGDDYQEYQSDVKLTLNKFPEGPDPNDPELITARVEYSLAVAAQMLAGYSEPPNEETPVILQGDNPEELRYVFTALATIGREVPLFKYDSTAIAIISNAFHYSQEMEKVFSLLGWREQFTQDSCYETCFKNQPSLKLWLAGIKEATEHKLGHQKERGQIKKAVGQVTHTFFGNTKSKEVIEELRQINELRGPECAG